jgi:hypothetical protein
MDRIPASAFFCGAFFLFASAAQAANIEVTQGEVLLSHGAGYQSIHGSAELLVGDMVVAKPDSAARISFADGCTIYLGMGMVFTVEARSPCGSSGAGGAAAKNADVAISGDWSAGTETLAVTDEVQANVTPYLLGAAVVGGIAAAASMLGGDGGPPVSP